MRVDVRSQRGCDESSDHSRFHTNLTSHQTQAPRFSPQQLIISFPWNFTLPFIPHRALFAWHLVQRHCTVSLWDLPAPLIPCHAAWSMHYVAHAVHACVHRRDAGYANCTVVNRCLDASVCATTRLYGSDIARQSTVDRWISMNIDEH